MTSKDALEKLFYGVGSEKENNENYMIIYKDLERLEKVEQENESLKRARDTLILNSRNTINELNTYIEELEEKNEKLSSEIDDLLDDKLVLVVKNTQQDMFIGKLIQENERLKHKLDDINSFSYSMPPYYRDIIKEMLGNE